ncbi:serine hydrolase domain-containing protein [Streptomyces coeruleorubidus]|uniref:serine hydrolase domain-containing protein n=1 Tax=Streptomyces coeruleorubidus TaxID=116188 RepID=UPI0037B3F490
MTPTPTEPSADGLSAPADLTPRRLHLAEDDAQAQHPGEAGPILDSAGVREAVTSLLSAATGASTVVVGLHRAGHRTLIARGRTTTHHDGVPSTPATRFEIGSLTKPFTALLLAEQAASGVLDLNDPLCRHLPAHVLLPPGGHAITLTHLATHTSGLPRLPPGLLRQALPALFTNPYVGFTTDQVLHALARTRLHAPPGTRLRYSNFGVGLLGHALLGAAGATDYAAFLHDRVLAPLRLHDTNCEPTPPAGTAQATGYRHRRPRPPFHVPGLPAAGALRASARDLLTLTEALLDPRTPSVPPTLRTALAEVRRPRLRLQDNRGMALVWNIRTRPDGTRLYHHAGATRGCTAFAGFNPQHATALVALTNTAPTLGNTFVQAAYTALIALQP